MAEQIRLVDYYYVTSPDKPGEGAEVLSVCRQARINLLTIHAFPRGRRTQVDLVPKNGPAFLRAARKAKWKLSGKKKAFLVTGQDRVGVMAPVLEKLTQAKVNVTAVTAVSAGKGRFGAILWVKPKDLRRASKALGL
ncbi:MAG: hypothetical protein ACE5JS_19425 [Nitrospinota bacterium]